MDAREEESITELEFMPDGRIFIFGASGEILDILNQIQQSRDAVVAQRAVSTTSVAAIGPRAEKPQHE
jgi:hypothetical protein